MTKRQKRRIIITILIILLFVITIERIYNSRDEFQVTAMDASNYGILEANLTTKEKLEDFEYLYSVLEKNFPFFKVNERLHGIDWLGNKSKYKRIIRNTRNDAEFLVALDRILDDLNDGHTNIFDGKGFKRFYKLYKPYSSQFPFWDDVFHNPYVLNRYNIQGSIESVEKMELYNESVLDTKILIEDEVAYMKIKSMATDDNIVKKDYEKIKEFLRGVEDYEKLIIDIRGNGGGWDIYWENIIKLLTDEPLSTKYYVFFKKGHRYKYDPYRVKYRKPVKELDKEILNKFPEEVKTDFDYYRIYSHRIDPWNPEFYPLEIVNFKGKVYLLVDRHVYSSAENFASFAKDSGFATLVGETTGGGKGFAWIPIVYLPNSKFAIRYSRELVMNADGTINFETKTIPHIIVNDATPHWDFTKDQCIRAVIKDKVN